MSAATCTSSVRQRVPGCLDGRLASPAQLGCALKENREAGAKRRYVTQAHPHEETAQGHGLDNGLSVKGTDACSPTR
jgi:hypothetical protein